FHVTGVQTCALPICNPNVYACGDVSDHSLPLTPLSIIEAQVVADNIINGNKEQMDTPVVPSVIFTLPNLATVGLNEKEAKTRYKNITDRKSTRLNSSHVKISYAVFCLKKKIKK